MTKIFAAVIALGMLLGATAPSFAADSSSAYASYAATAENNTAQ